MTQPSNPRPAIGSGGWRLAASVLGVVVVGLATALVLVLVNDDEALAPTSSTAPAPATSTGTVPATTPTSVSPTSTVPAIPTTSAVPATTQPPSGDLQIALWPAPSGPVGYTDPEVLVHDFAEQFVGMSDPEIGPYMAGDSRSGEIEVRAEPGAELATTVFVRQLGPNDLWWVLGAASANIVVDTPQPLEAVASPIELRGSALAFEGTVAVTLWADGAPEPLASSFVTGSGAPPAGPFSGELIFEPPAVEAGALLFTSASGEDGAVIESAALRVLFA